MNDTLILDIFIGVVITAILRYIFALLISSITNDSPWARFFYAIGARCYEIQSQQLHIPDQYGVFSAGPPRLQSKQALAFACMVMVRVCILYPAAVLMLYMAYISKGINYRYVAAYLAADVAFIAISWAIAILSPNRTLGCNSGDQKLHKE
ncbi:hypothetical protein B0I35DRAFT_416540 [Stachybotrys elegans]|uniref:Uncharacterized protein n=1 Tax=Stachybotrys elegans TaxID=80388 RepID=A0A8K0WVY4_9HYPO|nr:hypothetical protein B0I35DRAFT_416540 [Stachybotrys elegans]